MLNSHSLPCVHVCLTRLVPTAMPSHAMQQYCSLSHKRKSAGEARVLMHQSEAESVAKDLNLVPVIPQLSKEEEEEGMTYLKFTELIRPSIVDVNPGAEHTRINALLGALWRDYKSSKGIVPSQESSKGSRSSTKKSRRENRKQATGKDGKSSRKHEDASSAGMERENNADCDFLDPSMRTQLQMSPVDLEIIDYFNEEKGNNNVFKTADESFASPESPTDEKLLRNSGSAILRTAEREVDVRRCEVIGHPPSDRHPSTGSAILITAEQEVDVRRREVTGHPPSPPLEEDGVRGDCIWGSESGLHIKKMKELRQKLVEKAHMAEGDPVSKRQLTKALTTVYVDRSLTHVDCKTTGPFIGHGLTTNKSPGEDGKECSPGEDDKECSPGEDDKEWSLNTEVLPAFLDTPPKESEQESIDTTSPPEKLFIPYSREQKKYLKWVSSVQIKKVSPKTTLPRLDVLRPSPGAGSSNRTMKANEEKSHISLLQSKGKRPSTSGSLLNTLHVETSKCMQTVRVASSAKNCVRQASLSSKLDSVISSRALVNIVDDLVSNNGARKNQQLFFAPMNAVLGRNHRASDVTSVVEGTSGDETIGIMLTTEQPSLHKSTKGKMSSQASVNIVEDLVSNNGAKKNQQLFFDPMDAVSGRNYRASDVMSVVEGTSGDEPIGIMFTTEQTSLHRSTNISARASVNIVKHLNSKNGAEKNQQLFITPTPMNAVSERNSCAPDVTSAVEETGDETIRIMLTTEQPSLRRSTKEKMSSQASVNIVEHLSSKNGAEKNQQLFITPTPMNAVLGRNYRASDVTSVVEGTSADETIGIMLTTEQPSLHKSTKENIPARASVNIVEHLVSNNGAKKNQQLFITRTPMNAVSERNSCAPDVTSAVEETGDETIRIMLTTEQPSLRRSTKEKMGSQALVNIVKDSVSNNGLEKNKLFFAPMNALSGTNNHAPDVTSVVEDTSGDETIGIMLTTEQPSLDKSTKEKMSSQASVNIVEDLVSNNGAKKNQQLFAPMNAVSGRNHRASDVMSVVEGTSGDEPIGIMLTTEQPSLHKSTKEKMSSRASVTIVEDLVYNNGAEKNQQLFITPTPMNAVSGRNNCAPYVTSAVEETGDETIGIMLTTEQPSSRRSTKEKMSSQASVNMVEDSVSNNGLEKNKLFFAPMNALSGTNNRPSDVTSAVEGTSGDETIGIMLTTEQPSLHKSTKEKMSSQASAIILEHSYSKNGVEKNTLQSRKDSSHDVHRAGSDRVVNNQNVKSPAIRELVVKCERLPSSFTLKATKTPSRSIGFNLEKKAGRTEKLHSTHLHLERLSVPGKTTQSVDEFVRSFNLLGKPESLSSPKETNGILEKPQVVDKFVRSFNLLSRPEFLAKSGKAKLNLPSWRTKTLSPSDKIRNTLSTGNQVRPSTDRFEQPGRSLFHHGQEQVRCYSNGILVSKGSPSPPFLKDIVIQCERLPTDSLNIIKVPDKYLLDMMEQNKTAHGFDGPALPPKKKRKENGDSAKRPRKRKVSDLNISTSESDGLSKHKRRKVSSKTKKRNDSMFKLKAKKRKPTVPNHYNSYKPSQLPTISSWNMRYRVAFTFWPTRFSGALDRINHRIMNQNSFWDGLGRECSQ